MEKPPLLNTYKTPYADEPNNAPAPISFDCRRPVGPLVLFVGACALGFTGPVLAVLLFFALCAAIGIESSGEFVAVGAVASAIILPTAAVITFRKKLRGFLVGYWIGLSVLCFISIQVVVLVHNDQNGHRRHRANASASGKFSTN